MAMPIGDVAKPAVKLGDPTSGGTIGELGQKKINLEEPTNPQTLEGTPETRHVSAPIDRVNPKARFGALPGEKRLSADELGGMAKPLGAMLSYKHGTEYVKETGPALLHKGEAVIPKEKNMKNMKDHMMAGLSEGEDKKPKKEIKRIITHKSHDGKFIHTHEHHHPEHHPDETHVSNDMAELHQHMEDHAGSPNDGEAAPAAGAAAAAPMTAMPSAPAGAPAPAPMPGQ
jgi:hypothetical protein